MAFWKSLFGRKSTRLSIPSGAVTTLSIDGTPVDHLEPDGYGHVLAKNGICGICGIWVRKGVAIDKNNVLELIDKINKKSSLRVISEPLVAAVNKGRFLVRACKYEGDEGAVVLFGEQVLSGDLALAESQESRGTSAAASIPETSLASLIAVLCLLLLAIFDWIGKFWSGMPTQCDSCNGKGHYSHRGYWHNLQYYSPSTSVCNACGGKGQSVSPKAQEHLAKVQERLADLRIQRPWIYRIAQIMAGLLNIFFLLLLLGVGLLLIGGFLLFPLLSGH